MLLAMVAMDEIFQQTKGSDTHKLLVMGMRCDETEWEK